MEVLMDVSKFTFTEDEIAEFHKHRDNQPDARLKLRFIALLMLSKGFGPKDIASVTGKSEKTIENWYHQYVTKGIDSLNCFQYKPKQTYLTDEQIEQVVTWVKETNPCKIKEVREYIKDHFKVTCTAEAVRKLLKKTGLNYSVPKLFQVIRPAKMNKKKYRKIL